MLTSREILRRWNVEYMQGIRTDLQLQAERRWLEVRRIDEGRLFKHSDRSYENLLNIRYGKFGKYF